jgi:ABC-type oligopeptide transport system ATPase subunit
MVICPSFSAHLVALLRPDRGEVWVDEAKISHLSGRALAQVRKRVGLLFQGGALFDSLSVFDNVAFPLQETTDLSEAVIQERVRTVVAEVGLAGAGNKFPSELSGGMRKRAAIARAAATAATPLWTAARSSSTCCREAAPLGTRLEDRVKCFCATFSSASRYLTIACAASFSAWRWTS